MATRFWVGGTGNWDQTTLTHWAATSGGAGGATVPTASDTVTFDSASNATAYTVTVTAIAPCSDLSLAGPASGALTFAGTSVVNCAGSFIIAAAGVTKSWTGGLNFTSTTAGKTITTNGISFANQISFGNGGASASWTLQDNFNITNAIGVSLVAGTLITNGKTLTCTTFTATNSGTARALTLGASTINCTTWNISATGTTLTAGTSTINVSGSSAFIGGGFTYNIVNLTGNNNVSISGANTFATLSISPTSPTKSDDLSIAASQTITGTFTVSDGATATNRVFVHSSTVGTPITITAAAISISNADFMDITGAGAATWNMSAASGGSGDCGGNTMQALGATAFTTAVDQHWLNASSSSWSTAANWTSRVPLPQDNVFMNKAFGTSQTVTADMPRLGKSIDWTGATWTTALTFSATVVTSVFGSWIWISGITPGTPNIIFRGRSSYNYDLKGLQIRNTFTLNAPSGTLTLLSNFDASGGTAQTFTVTNGTFDASGFSITFGSYSMATGSTLLMGSGTWTANGINTVWSNTGNITPSTSTIKITDTSATAVSFSGGGKTYANIWFSRGASAASNTIVGSNTFSDFKDDGSAAHSIIFTAGISTTVSTFTCSGSSGNAITINSTSTAIHSLIKTGGGVISCDWLNIQHSVATPGSTWYAGANSVNNQATVTAGSGWIFTVPPVGGITYPGFFSLAVL